MQSAAAIVLMPLLIFFATAVTHIAFQWARQPQILPLPLGGSGLPSNTWFLESTWVNRLIDISVEWAVFAGLMNVHGQQTDTETDHATPCIAKGRIGCTENSGVENEGGSKIGGGGTHRSGKCRKRMLEWKTEKNLLWKAKYGVN